MSETPVPRACRSCSTTFQPKAKAYNAAYCSSRCKNRMTRARLKVSGDKDRQARERYQRVRSDPVRMATHRANGRRSVRKAREWLAAYKLERGCVDCGYDKHFAALQLDHTGPKSVEISSARSSISRLQREIDNGKCEVRCANCHAIKTWREKQPIGTQSA